jgi:hypothetical protein
MWLNPGNDRYLHFFAYECGKNDLSNWRGGIADARLMKCFNNLAYSSKDATMKKLQEEKFAL